MKQTSRYQSARAVVTGLLVMLVIFGPGAAFAGTGGAEFQPVYNQVLGYIDGYLGKLIALLAFIIGLSMGAARGSPVMAISGVVFALFIAFGPGIIEGIATATI